MLLSSLRPGEYSQELPVLSDIPQGSVFGTVLFIIYLSDVVVIQSDQCMCYLYADDAKLYRYVFNTWNPDMLRQGCHKLSEWSNTWLLILNMGKCNSMSIKSSSKRK